MKSQSQRIRDVIRSLQKKNSTRNFGLVLLNDGSRSMSIWQPVVAELQQALERYAVFREIDAWNITYHGIGIALTRQTQNGITVANKGELAAAPQRQMVMIVSDCVSETWHNGKMAQLIELFSQHHLVVILQLLPRRLWKGSGLGNGVHCGLKSEVACPTNQYLIDDDQEYDSPFVKVPVLSIDGEDFTQFLGVLRGSKNAWVSGVVLTTRPYPSVAKTEMTALQRLQRFNALASPKAQELLVNLASHERLTLDMMWKQINDCFDYTHLAEVFLGGILKRDDEGFVFHSGIRELLLCNKD